MGRVAYLLVLVLPVLTGVARAAPDNIPSAAPIFSDDPDADAARRHYERGLRAYDRADFAGAIREFELARSLKPSAAFDYNIGRCFDRLERWSLAADAYVRYLAAEPAAPNGAALRERLRVLRARAQLGDEQTATAALQLAATRRRGRIAGWTLGGLALAFAGGGLGAYLSPRSAYDAKAHDCRNGCAEADVAALRSQVHRAEVASAALFGVAGALAVADVVVWAVAGRAQRPRGDR